MTYLKTETGIYIFGRHRRKAGKPLIFGKTLVDGKGVKGDVILNGTKVQTITQSAFYGNKNIKKVKILDKKTTSLDTHTTWC